MVNRIVLNTVSYHGSGAVKEIGPELSARGFKKALVCSGKHVVKSGEINKILDPMKAAGIDYALFTDIKANPTIENVQNGVQAFKDAGADCIVAVGGGSIILPEKIHGAASVLKPEHFGCANAIGSAISKVSGTYEKLMNYDELPREQSLEKARHEAIELAVEAGAVRETVEIIEMEDVPLAYYPGNTNRVKIKAAGDLS